MRFGLPNRDYSEARTSPGGPGGPVPYPIFPHFLWRRDALPCTYASGLVRAGVAVGGERSGRDSVSGYGGGAADNYGDTGRLGGSAVCRTGPPGGGYFLRRKAGGRGIAGI